MRVFRINTSKIYNAENRPVRWVKDNIVITMNFDRMGRRVFYKEEVAGVVTKHHKFVYDNYLCVQKVDALNNNSQINLFVWDPTEPVATRPLFTQRGTGYKFFYTCDGNKNVSELVHFETRNGIAAHYDYAPFCAVTRSVSASTITDNTFTTDNPFRFSSEYHDDTLGLVYYNYRHYNFIDGRWLSRDSIGEISGLNLFFYVTNYPLNSVDCLGLASREECVAILMNIRRKFFKFMHEVEKFDRAEDAKGGHISYYAGRANLTKPNGHLKEMGDLVRGIRNDLKEFAKKCFCFNDDDEPPHYPKKIETIINLPLAKEAEEYSKNHPSTEWTPQYLPPVIFSTPPRGVTPPLNIVPGAPPIYFFPGGMGGMHRQHLVPGVY